MDGLIEGIFIAAITTVMYPMLSKTANKNNYNELKESMINGINIVLLITILATIGMEIMVESIVKIVFQSGKLMQ